MEIPRDPVPKVDAPGETVPRWTGPFGDQRAYRIDEPRRYLRGGLGVVYQAVISSGRHGSDLVGTPVGLKQLTGIDDYRWHRLEERSSALAAVDHPNLSRHLGVFTGPRPQRNGMEPDDDDPQRYIVHVWVDGRPLAESVDADVGTVLRWLRQIAGGLDRLHSHEAGPFAHRDLHPRNVIVNAAGEAVVIDFDTVFAGAIWTKTRMPNESRFAARSSTSVSPQVADRIALAKIALHSFAGDGDGVLDEKEVLESAARRLQGQKIRPEPVLALLEAALDGRAPDSCTELISQLEAAIGGGRGRPLIGRRRALGFGPSGSRSARPAGRGGRSVVRQPWALALVIALVALIAGATLAFTQGGESEAGGPKQGDVDPETSVPGESTTTTASPTTTAIPAVADAPVVGPAPVGQPAATGSGPASGARSDIAPSDTVANREVGGTSSSGASPAVASPTQSAASVDPIVDRFDADAQGWTVINDAQLEHHQTGGNPGGYVSGTDIPRSTTWFWEAPARYRGDRSAYVGRSLTFDLKQSITSDQFDAADVWLIAADATELVFDTASNPATGWTSYTVRLDGGTAWQKVTPNGNVRATADDLRAVLGNLLRLRIRGEYAAGVDVGGLDNVVFGA